MTLKINRGTPPKQYQALCIISSPYMKSYLSYGPEMANLGFDLCNLDFWPLSLNFCIDITSVIGYCSGSLEPESSCHDRDWIMELPMEADILTFTGILTPEDASVASCCSGSAGASVVAHGVALPLYRDCFLDLRLFNSPDLRRLVLCYCCQAWTLETVLGGNTALPRWWTARSIDADAKR